MTFVDLKIFSCLPRSGQKEELSREAGLRAERRATGANKLISDAHAQKRFLERSDRKVKPKPPTR